MDPHVFAKFERVSFNARLHRINKDELVLWPTLFVDDKFYTSREDEATLLARLNGQGSDRLPLSNIIRQFVDVLVQSPYISRLDICLTVEIEGGFDIVPHEGREKQIEKEHNKEIVRDLKEMVEGNLVVRHVLFELFDRSVQVQIVGGLVAYHRFRH